MLSEAITFEDKDEECFTPSYGIDDDPYLCDAYDYESEFEATVLSTWCIMKRASLPVDTFALAVLILRQLKPRFYREWSIEIDVLHAHGRPERTQVDRPKELVIVAAIVSIPLRRLYHMLT